MLRHATLAIIATGVLVLSGCDLIGSETDDPALKVVEEKATFEEDEQGWSGDFSDYPVADSGDGMNLTFDRRALPEDVDTTGHALYLSGRNLSDDLFMFLKKRISGLEAERSYRVYFEARIASNAPSNCVGIGGPPGEAVYLKAGAAPIEPEPVAESGDFRMNVDKGNQSTGGEHADVIGNVANGVEECHDTPYRMITRSTEEPILAETNENGELWVFVGTDSGFEGTTSLYYHRLNVRAVPVSEGTE